MSGARMWPSRMPKHIREDRHRRSEVKVYDLLADQLGKDWVVFYSRPWLGLSPTGEEKDGECDFVVVHPAHGFLAVEVKGGGISYDPASDKWLSCDRDGIRHKIKNPVEQARSSKHELFRKVRQQKHWPQGRFIRMRHGVVFPDAEDPPASLGPDRPRGLFCCRSDLTDIAGWVLSRLSGGDGEPIGHEGVRAFEDLLAAPFQLTVPLSHYLDDDDKSIASLTPQQFHILDAVSQLPRVAAGGGAGTGKTILAMEDASRTAQQGLRTAFLCLSEKLAAHVRDRLAPTDVDVWSFAEFCQVLARAASLPVASGTTDLDVMVEWLGKAVALAPSLRYDAIIVDEAQDFRTHWWIALEDVLRDSVASKLHAFFDTNQSIYGNLAGELASFRIVPIQLTRNLRNTQNIHHTASRFYKGIPISAEGPEGFSVEWIPANGHELAATALRAIRRLVHEDGVEPENIIILSEQARLLSEIRDRPKFPEGVAVDTISNFKGLERQTVVVVATREIADQPELAYVALSRPRVHLLVIGEAEILDWLAKHSSA